MFTDWHKIDMERTVGNFVRKNMSDNHMRSVSTTSFPPLPILLMIVTKIIVLIIIIMMIVIMIIITMMMMIIVIKTMSQRI